VVQMLVLMLVGEGTEYVSLLGKLLISGVVNSAEEPRQDTKDRNGELQRRQAFIWDEPGGAKYLGCILTSCS
jgi:hypothetical protein